MKKRVTFTLDEETIERLQKLSKETMIPQSRIVELAIIEKLDKMEKGTK
ncbi:MAG: ribbon-helix-helix domain-containing protein [Clostridia bacterium]|nr:ribbon-helix-helix domain-containing protein [Clostridia bacterium]